ncbi:MAG: response regulator transcription factor [Chloroflexi bacterium]|nr:response regulator transcription factor [Chloroflexota bacterium]
MAPALTSVVVVAAAPALRAGLRALIEGAGDVDVAQASAAAPNTFEAGSVIVLADDSWREGLAMIAGDEDAPAAAFLGEADAPAVVVMTGDPSAPLELQQLPLLGWAVVAPDAREDQLLAAIRSAAAGLVAMPRDTFRPASAAVSARTGVTRQSEPLTAREREVLQLLGEGLSNKLIARRLQISEHTVKFHISSVYAKLDATNRTEAVSHAARGGLITL